ncbi:DUF72 domain-containing protein [Pseudomonas sp. Marseille-P9899]|uniref:DUF72 domain-containing protein n=1 Tax=Pseudomonas sp. Marseille-P9899 TaxID=2730401 RepID=UPI00158D9F3F|nr:DUF72 domain-containing protein [Pseudomonas sp. Marseille-P9899]
MSEIHIGISGWRYAPWRKQFYPEGLIQAKELAFASRAVSSIEINGSFYALQTPQRYAEWRDDTPDGFVFAVKAPRYITHVRRLKEIAEPLANFFASGPLQLGDKLGPILWQFPPSMTFDPQRFADFFERLPQDRHAATQCARQCSTRMNKDGAFHSHGNGPLRHAVEIRNESFRNAEFIDLLRKHGVALVVADTAGKWPYLEDLTADFLYLRLHGDAELYASGYTESALQRWAQRIRTWSRGQQPADAQLAGARKDAVKGAKDVYCYFDNDLKVRAPFDARDLLERLKLAGGLETVPGERWEI